VQSLAITNNGGALRGGNRFRFALIITYLSGSEAPGAFIFFYSLPPRRRYDNIIAINQRMEG